MNRALMMAGERLMSLRCRYCGDRSTLDSMGKC